MQAFNKMWDTRFLFKTLMRLLNLYMWIIGNIAPIESLTNVTFDELSNILKTHSFSFLYKFNMYFSILMYKNCLFTRHLHIQNENQSVPVMVDQFPMSFTSLCWREQLQRVTRAVICYIYRSIILAYIRTFRWQTD